MTANRTQSVASHGPRERIRSFTRNLPPSMVVPSIGAWPCFYNFSGRFTIETPDRGTWFRAVEVRGSSRKEMGHPPKRAPHFSSRRNPVRLPAAHHEGDPRTDPPDCTGPGSLRDH